MKNVYIIPTKELDGDWLINIYITSSDEEIKLGDWACHKSITNDKYQLVKCTISNKESIEEHWNKIILTTDQELIADGVQPIDDKFLEWFVKNPSCEKVKIESWQTKGEWDLDYKIIITEEPKLINNCSKCGLDLVIREASTPVCTDIDCRGIILSNETLRECASKKEEQKQHLIDIMKGDEELGLYDEELKQDYSGVHLRHCYQGEYEDGCKYGEDDCPAKPKEEPTMITDWLDEYGDPEITKIVEREADDVVSTEGVKDLSSFVRGYNKATNKYDVIITKLFNHLYDKMESISQEQIDKDSFQLGRYRTYKQIFEFIQTLSEPKPIIRMGKKYAEPNKTHYLDELPNMDRDVLAKMWESAIPKLSSKQETVEEAALKLYPKYSSDPYNPTEDVLEEERNIFIAGTKWQQERSYSEEEVIALLESLVEHPTKPGYKRKDILKVIEQLKTKQ